MRLDLNAAHAENDVSVLPALKEAGEVREDRQFWDRVLQHASLRVGGQGPLQMVAWIFITNAGHAFSSTSYRSRGTTHPDDCFFKFIPDEHSEIFTIQGEVHH